jgi:hypothetical protein
VDCKASSRRGRRSYKWVLMQPSGLTPRTVQKHGSVGQTHTRGDKPSAKDKR